jgi:3-hydroxyisobutyrate dehydrogenase-like beta-hydroxyacid dehydrogenase
MDQRIAFLGLGTMGAEIATHLCAAGLAPVLWNRSDRGLRGDPRFAGATFAATPAAAVADSEFVLYCLGSEAAIDAVVFGADGILSGIRPGQLAIDLSTSHPDISRRQARAYGAAGVHFLDAALFGSRPEARAAQLQIVVGGEAAQLERAAPVFRRFSSSTHHMGAHGAGTSMGLVGSLVVCLQMQALSEALVLARKAGLDLNAVVELLGLTDFRSPLFTAMGPDIIRRRFDAVFSLGHLYKDARQIMQLANQLSVPVPGCAVVHEMIKSAAANGLAAENCSALIKVLEQQARVTAQVD